MLVGSHLGERSRFRADQADQDQFGDVGHDLDLGFTQADGARADIDGKRGGQQPGGPPLQRRGQTRRRPRKGPEFFLQAAQRPAGRVHLPRYRLELIAGRCLHRAVRLGQLERHGRKLLDRPVMQQVGQVTAFPCAKPAHDVKQQLGRGSSHVGAVLGRSARDREPGGLIVHDRLPLRWAPPTEPQ